VQLRRLQLEHFRNYPALELELGAGMHVFAGANAQGKTNLLEAVYLTATGRSPRTNQEGEMIGWDGEVARVVGAFESAQRGPLTVEVSLGRKGAVEEGRRGGTAQKRIKVNGGARSVADLAGLVPVVLFLVEDLEIVRGEPARRRDFLDNDLAAMSRTYAWALRQYTRVVEQRNRLLKDIREGTADAGDLWAWNDQLALYGGRLMEVRLRFLADLNPVSVPVYQGLTASSQGMTLVYRREWGDPDADPTTRDDFAGLILDALESVASEEMRRGSSLVGPHRDDVHFLVDGKDVRQFGSQGEQRTAALALRVAEFMLLTRLLHEPPVLLLDDILSELDRTRRAALLEHLASVAQVIVTTTDVDASGLPARPDVTLHRVSGGMVEGWE
jgi:DNA replication and repair protein RecF